MKTLSLLFLMLPLLSLNTLDDKNKGATVPTVEDKEVYIIHTPQAEYELLGMVHHDEMLDASGRIEKLITLAKEQYGEGFDAIITRDGRSAKCIKFSENSNGQANYTRASKNEVYILSTPSKEFKIDYSETLQDAYVKLPFYRLISILSNMADKKGDCDAVILTKDNQVQYIKY